SSRSTRKYIKDTGSINKEVKNLKSSHYDPPDFLMLNLALINFDIYLNSTSSSTFSSTSSHYIESIPFRSIPSIQFNSVYSMNPVQSIPFRSFHSVHFVASMVWNRSK
ncbi:hypothetical protein BpHYR1_036472, partial [Brachionus plicatilis]